ncbi:hypothetical protein ACO1O0_005461 [Amphichorda felina]
MEPPTKVVNLDFEARVPVPFSIFPSTYKDSEAQTTTSTHEELEIKLPSQKPGREGQYSSISATAQFPQRGERYDEEVRYTREEERYRRPGIQHEHEHFAHEHSRPPAPRSEYTDTHIEIDAGHKPFTSPIDVAERQYRERFSPKFHSTVDSPSRPHYQPATTHVDNFTVDAAARVPSSSFRESVHVSDTTVEPTRFTRAQQKANMGYYDEDGHYHSFRHGVHKLADRIAHPRGHEHHHHIDVDVHEKGGAPPPRASSSGDYTPNTVTIPCHHIRLGDFLMLQGRPCQVIRISTSSATGQYRYLGVDLFTKQLHEESSFISNPAPSVVVQTMLGPVFKQYRVLDISEGYVTAMTETGDVKQGLSVIDQSNLHARLTKAFESGRGSVRILVINDNGQELAVDMKVVHGSRL